MSFHVTLAIQPPQLSTKGGKKHFLARWHQIKILTKLHFSDWWRTQICLVVEFSVPSSGSCCCCCSEKKHKKKLLFCEKATGAWVMQHWKYIGIQRRLCSNWRIQWNSTAGKAEARTRTACCSDNSTVNISKYETTCNALIVLMQLYFLMSFWWKYHSSTEQYVCRLFLCS